MHHYGWSYNNLQHLEWFCLCFQSLTLHWLSSVQVAFTGLSSIFSFWKSGPVLWIVAGLILCSLLFLDLWVVSLEHSQVIVHFSSFVETGTLDHNLRDLSKRVHAVYFKAQLMVLFRVNRKTLLPWRFVGRFLRKCVDHGQELGCSIPVVTVQLAFCTTQIHKGSMFAWDVDVVAIWHDAFQKRAVLLSISVLQTKAKHKFIQRTTIWMSHKPALPCMCFKFFDSCLLTTWRGQGCYCCFFSMRF